MNQFELIGKVCEEPERSETNSGIKMARIKLSVDKGKDDDKTPELYEVTVFRQLAELDLRVGQYVSVVGKLTANNYEKENKTYFNCQLIGNILNLIGE